MSDNVMDHMLCEQEGWQTQAGRGMIEGLRQAGPEDRRPLLEQIVDEFGDEIMQVLQERSQVRHLVVHATMVDGPDGTLSFQQGGMVPLPGVDCAPQTTDESEDDRCYCCGEQLARVNDGAPADKCPNEHCASHVALQVGI